MEAFVPPPQSETEANAKNQRNTCGTGLSLYQQCTMANDKKFQWTKRWRARRDSNLSANIFAYVGLFVELWFEGQIKGQVIRNQ
jgi:hypothetical protein